MGFRPAMSVHDIEWPEGHRLHGLHVKAASVPTDKFNEINRLMSVPGASGAENADRNDQLIDEFAACLRSWDYEDPKTGLPLTADRAGLGRIDPGHVIEIIAAWTLAMVTVPPPLPPGSSNGNSPSDSQEGILNLASTSQNLSS